MTFLTLAAAASRINPVDIIEDQVRGATTAFIALLPNILAAIVMLLIAWGAGRALQRLVERVLVARGRHDLGGMLGTLAKGLLIGAAWLFASAVVFPSIRPGDILSMLGIGSVAIGFAFKDILQNLLAGLLLLIRRPYRRGDQIIVRDFEGTVESIESRATLIKTYDGRLVIIPNSDIYTSPVTVNTAYEQRRDDYTFGIGYGDDAARAITIFRDAIATVEGVLSEPAPDVLPWALNESSVDLKARWWTASKRGDQVRVRARVILTLFLTAKEHGIDLPFPTQMVLFHDQTERGDGDRSNQREGWPGKSEPAPRPDAAPAPDQA